jgi:hypothetical protein
MITDEELMQKIEKAVSEYKGDISYLNEAVGMIVVGRLMGWEHQRLVTPRATWYFALKLFGDVKSPDFMPRRGRLAYKSCALQLIDRVGDYWGVVTGKKSALSLQEKRQVI